MDPEKINQSSLRQLCMWELPMIPASSSIACTAPATMRMAAMNCWKKAWMLRQTYILEATYYEKDLCRQNQVTGQSAAGEHAASWMDRCIVSPTSAKR